MSRIKSKEKKIIIIYAVFFSFEAIIGFKGRSPEKKIIDIRLNLNKNRRRKDNLLKQLKNDNLRRLNKHNKYNKRNLRRNKNKHNKYKKRYYFMEDLFTKSNVRIIGTLVFIIRVLLYNLTIKNLKLLKDCFFIIITKKKENIILYPTFSLNGKF